MSLYNIVLRVYLERNINKGLNVAHNSPLIAYYYEGMIDAYAVAVHNIYACICIHALVNRSIENGREVMVKWSCGHEGRLSTSWLRDHCYSSSSLLERSQRGIPESTPHVIN